jgi:uncharacterized protein (TIGR04255 family)
VPAIDDPSVSLPPPEVPLTKAPLVRVIAQVRFPLVVSVEQRNFIAPFQEAIRGAYPVLRQEKTQGFLMTPAGPAAVAPQAAWRFADMDGQWRVSLSPDFLALETSAYTSRSDFVRRLKDVVAALGEHVAPKLVDRLGVRFIDRVSGAAVDDIAKLFRPEVRGIVGTASAGHAQQTLTESLFSIGSALLLARWGLMPPGQTVDPAAIEQSGERSWILDFDMFSTAPFPFATDRIIENARHFAERIYCFFRWAVTDDFLRRYGGNT